MRRSSRGTGGAEECRAHVLGPGPEARAGPFVLVLNYEIPMLQPYHCSRFPMGLRRKSKPTMGEQRKQAEGHEQRIRDWQLLLLRFAITREGGDRAAAAASAAELDAAILSRRRSFTFFARTTEEFCEAIVGVRDQHTTSILCNCTARIEDARLRAAFRACLDLQEASASRPRPQRAAWRDRQDLWRGLPKR